MLHYYNHVIWFKVCRPLRNKYRLSVNTLLCLVSAYCYIHAVNKPFTTTNLLRFAQFFNDKRMKYYVNILMTKGYIIESASKNCYTYYIVSPSGNCLMKELEESYNKELVLFCSKYSIEL
jgi:hypothetical protein